MKTAAAMPLRHTPGLPVFLISSLLLAAPAGAGEAFPPAAELPDRPELPDPFTAFGGKKVATAEEWSRERRPELKALFQHYMYGSMPPAPGKVESRIERSDAKYLGGKATKKEVEIRFGPPAAPAIHLLLVVPTARQGRAPVFLASTSAGTTR